MDNQLVPALDRTKINKLEALMKEYPQVELPVNHHFSKGLYARELHIFKGVLLTGKIHKYGQLNILAKGKMRISVGDKYMEIEAPYIVSSPPGTKRAALALEDCVWVTIHGTEETNLDLIEKEFIAQDEPEYLEFIDDKQLRLL